VKLLKPILLQISIYGAVGCSSGFELGQRNLDIFAEAAGHKAMIFTTQPNTVEGQILALRNAIMARADNNEATCASTPGCPTTEIEGIASTGSMYNFAITTNGTVTDGSRGTGICFDSTATSNSDGSQPWHCGANVYCSTAPPGSTGWATQGDMEVYTRSFFLHDKDSGILILYGLEPPSFSVADISSMKHINNARNNGLVRAGDRVRLKVEKVRRYGVDSNAIAVITDFSGLTVVSQANPITYVMSTAPFAPADEYKVLRIEGTVSIHARYWEINCSLSSTRDYRFQFNHEDGYVGEITDSSNNKYCFKLSYNMGAGTLSGFDTGDMFSYNFSPGVKVRLTGPVFYPKNRRAGVGIKSDVNPVTQDPRIATSGLCLAVDQKFQAETLR
jgi:hypothetical protein